MTMNKSEEVLIKAQRRYTEQFIREETPHDVSAFPSHRELVSVIESLDPHAKRKFKRGLGEHVQTARELCHGDRNTFDEPLLSWDELVPGSQQLINRIQ